MKTYIASSTFLPFLVLLVGHLFPTVEGILCYQCNSTDHENPFQCQEFMEEDIDIQPTSCDTVYNAAFCIKHTGRFEGGVGTRRYCSSVDMGNYCDYIRQPGDNKDYRSCVYTCSTDGCNSAPSTSFHWPNFFLTSVLIFPLLR